ncbi:NAD(P)/FAD-dependent oxidoreductase [Anaerococcus hydrogenalis]|uniref:Aminoacetone oxidase family FAD-binding enzyme n=1 Tax=Anaerococcus hydrogenalis TaxID=33029 RepID=A0A2N6ULC6_9FIRM|nr:NAD(P)/FAD-dependent oxidoreductase [Anaerococcus hydrogenalis]MDK7694632.1 NAD(P)/FAD-dependent oxidoreductase [Anaerococcus hydrogenalis]MDK7696410.1 NAD(P)/FAD-dependent oxidoreductase [Anaerococcus hydrogenalis]MDK7707659.1 NAD(P)/FAD-dependent oxidoreductase [Anaerococcus hydrogenalis]PMC82670.1 aminoacetone oxidase family FAD-binding enzyme [Anaerococcus hydrogenalis]
MDIGIIGAGAAGVFTAINAKNKNNKVIIIEKNKQIGKKLFITGKGRCNITNAKFFDEFLDNIVVNKKFMYSSFTNFDNYALMDYLENKGLKLVVQRGDRVFPKSEKSSDVIKFFENLITKNHIDLKLNEKVEKILKDEKGKFLVKTNKDTYSFDKLVIATGGLSYPLTGSTGDGYKFAKEFSHNLIETKSALCPIRFKDKDLDLLNGISLRNVSLNVETKDRNFSEFGEMLIGKDFITGPIVLTMSSLINKSQVKGLYIDLKPALDFEKLDNRIVRDFENDSNKDIVNVLKNLLLNAFVEVILERVKIDFHKKVNQITKEERYKLIDVIKHFKLEFNGLSHVKNAVVTSGGVDCKELNPKNMESKKVQGLYFVGEVTDVDALTGGYNLQIAFSQAYACAEDLRSFNE